MFLLSADTSGKHGSIALARADDPRSAGVQVLEVVPLAGGTFSAQLIPQVSQLLNKHNFIKNDIGAFVVASGPGSFTGLRVGLAAIKGLAEILQKPIATVSLLEAVAVISGIAGNISAVLDAGRGEFYVGEYELTDADPKCVSERLVSREEFLALAKSSHVVSPDKNVGDLLQTSGIRVTLIAPIDAGAIAEIGYKKIKAGQTVSPEQLEANYIRRSDAEIFAKPRS